MGDLLECKELDFRTYTPDMLIFMSVLAGCDYCPSVPKVSLKVAHNIVKQYKHKEEILKHLQNHYQLPDGYEQEFTRAVMTFKHQRVYCIKTNQIVPLHPLPEGLGDIDYIGPAIAPDMARLIAFGDINPKTGDPYRVAPIQSQPTPIGSLESEEYSQSIHFSMRNTKPKSTLDSFLQLEPFYPLPTLRSSQAEVVPPPTATPSRVQPLVQVKSRYFAEAPSPAKSQPSQTPTRVDLSASADKSLDSTLKCSSDVSSHSPPSQKLTFSQIRRSFTLKLYSPSSQRCGLWQEGIRFPTVSSTNSLTTTHIANDHRIHPHSRYL